MSTQTALQTAIESLARHQNLSQAEAESAMDTIMSGEATPAQIGGYLMALRIKGETVDEITGSALSMRRAANHPPIDDARGLVDTCGTGGDGAHTFNISTTVAFVTAGTGIPVAKHGNRSVSSKSGSADVLGALGVNINLQPDQVAECVNDCGIGFMFAPNFHPAMKHAIGPRRELGVRTIFNILGPLANPAGARRQLIGVFAQPLTQIMAEVLLHMGAERAMVVHGHNGLDELATSGFNIVSELVDGRVETYTLDPTEYGFPTADPRAYEGGDPETNAKITRDILSGAITDAKRDIVLLNAGAAITIGGKADNLADGIRMAAESIDSGAAAEKLLNLAECSQQFAAVK